MFIAKATERSYYASLISAINRYEGSGVSEILYASEPDIKANLFNREWIISVKIGNDNKTIKEAFLQYLRHKSDTGIVNGMIVFLPDTARKTKVTQEDIDFFIETEKIMALVETPQYRSEIVDNFPNILRSIKIALASDTLENHLPLGRIIAILQHHLAEMMNTISLSSSKIVEIVTDKELLMDLGQMQEQNAEPVARFLAAYIYLSQIMFLRLLSTNCNELDIVIHKPIKRATLRSIFSKILKIDYKHIFGTDILDSIDDKYLQETFELIWGLEIEKVRYELTGRVFHDLMPLEIRKLTAAFYTRPLAAELLCDLSIDRSTSTVLDPACGSGTILTAAYKRKLELWRKEKLQGNPHKRFCENEIFGFDIMPFAVHLTSANLASLEPGIILDRTQIIHGDSLDMDVDTSEAAGIAMNLFPGVYSSSSVKGQRDEIELQQVDVLVMNPPFTKMERGVKRFVRIEKYANIVGQEVGLWGHFIALAQQFVKEDSIMGAVIPINLLRGTESKKVRDFLLSKWTILYVLKPSVNYAFSESSEYRDIILVASKGAPPSGHKTKFCIVKEDLTKLDSAKTKEIAIAVQTNEHLREHALVDVDTYSIEEIMERSNNLMWFCGVSRLSNRDVINAFNQKVFRKLGKFASSMAKGGYRPSKNVSSFLFLTRALSDARTEEAFLKFTLEDENTITCLSRLQNASYTLKKSSFLPSLRTPVGIASYNISGKHDYIAFESYQGIGKIYTALGEPERDYKFWVKTKREIDSVKANLVVSRRINPFSPSACLIAFYSEEQISPSDQLNVILCSEKERAKALCVILNSVVFFSQFFILKEESTGRYIDIRLYDLAEMYLEPNRDQIDRLLAVFEKFQAEVFPSIGTQFNKEFDSHYYDYKISRSRQLTLWMDKSEWVGPYESRLQFDKEVCKAIGIEVTDFDLLQLYRVFSSEMIYTRGLIKD